MPLPRSTVIGWCLQAELDVQLSVNEPLLTETQRKDANLMSITMETLFSPPDSWAIGGAQQGFTYVAAMPMPLSADVRFK